MFLRHDDDHKFVAADAELRSTLAKADLSALDEATYNELMRLYPDVREDEGWHGAEIAFSHLKNKVPAHA